MLPVLSKHLLCHSQVLRKEDGFGNGLPPIFFKVKQKDSGAGQLWSGPPLHYKYNLLVSGIGHHSRCS